MAKGDSSGIGIGQFFANVLNAPRKNLQWSWGAIDESKNRVFLNIWGDQHEHILGTKCARVFDESWKPNSAGSRERRRQLDRISSGAIGFGVVCIAKDKHATKKRTIKTFEERELLELGPFHVVGNRTFAEIRNTVLVDEIALTHDNPLLVRHDIEEIMRSPLTATTKKSLVDARCGQDQFRRDVLAIWGHRCAVTGSKMLQAIRASHIKAWKDSDNAERLDPHNGLPLVVHLDVLFDCGLISFEPSGRLLVSPLLDADDRKIFGLQSASLIRIPTPRTQAYLQEHREYKFKQS